MQVLPYGSCRRTFLACKLSCTQLCWSVFCARLCALRCYSSVVHIHQIFGQSSAGLALSAQVYICCCWRAGACDRSARLQSLSVLLVVILPRRLWNWTRRLRKPCQLTLQTPSTSRSASISTSTNTIRTKEPSGTGIHTPKTAWQASQATT